jgi:eukaryotic-like serine/threonine-protein kinase
MQLPTDRIRTLATRSRFRIGGALVQPDRLVVTMDDRDIVFEPRMMEVLVALAEHAGEVVTAEQLLIEVWRGSFYGDNPVHKAIAYLRKALGDDLKSPRYIETIRKRGYRLVAKVTYPEDYRRVAEHTAAWGSNSPYVGLAAFDSHHAGVFFGRSRATAELLAAMRQQIDNQRRFVLIVGASGCGKSSLLNAGAVPLLCQPGGFDGMHALALARCDLAGLEAGDALTHLATALSAWSLGERPVFAPGSAADLADAIRRSPESITATIEDAFRRHPSRELAEQPHAHLLLLIDHAEALVATAAQDLKRDHAFSDALHHLCESPRVMVAMIVRSDFYLTLVETYPEIAARKLGEGHFDVLTPLPGEIAQIIRIPASLAGLTFEEDSHSKEHLDDVLRDAANEHADALPLLQHTLQALYERRSDAGELRFDAYRAIGGLEGALAHRAEEVFASLHHAAKSSLDLVFSKLIVMQQESDAVSARRVLWSALDEDARVLAEAFVRARLFIGDLSDGQAGFRVAHEALLRQWPRARDWTHDNRRLLQAKARMRRSATRWVEEGRSADHLLNPGRLLQEAQEVARHVADLNPDEHAFLAASSRQYQRRRRLRTAGIATLAISTIISVSFAVLVSQARSEAVQRREEALQLSDFMLVDLAKKLRPLGRLQLLDEISGKALQLLDQHPEERLQTADLVNRARALNTLGEVMMEEARFDKADAAFAGADRAVRLAASREPASIDVIAETGTTAYWLGYTHFRRDEYKQTARHWAAYLASSEQLVRSQPNEAKWLVEQSYALNNLGTLAQKNDRIEQALDQFQRSADLKRRALRLTPHDDSLRIDLVDTLSWISSSQASRGQLTEAASGYAEQIDMLRTVTARQPDAQAWNYRLATALLRSAMLAESSDRMDDAERLVVESIQRLQALTAIEPDNRVWARDLAHALLEGGDIARLRGDTRTSRARLEQALARSSALRAKGEILPEWRRMDALIRVRLAGSGPAANFDPPIADLRRLTQASPEDPAYRGVLATALLARGIAHDRQRSTDAARADWREALSWLAPIAHERKDTNAISLWVEAHALLGERDRVNTDIAWLQRIGHRLPSGLAQGPTMAIREGTSTAPE